MGFWDAKKRRKKYITLQVNDGLAERDEKRTVRVLKVFKGQMTNSSKSAVSSEMLLVGLTSFVEDYFGQLHLET